MTAATDRLPLTREPFDDQIERHVLHRWSMNLPIELAEPEFSLWDVPGIVIGGIPELLWATILCVLAAAAITLTAVLP